MTILSIGTKVVATFPNSCFRLGGKVFGVIQVQGKEPEYVVEFLDGSHNHFASSNVTPSP